MIREKILLGDNENVHLTTYILESLNENQKRPAVIICPGGAYLYTSKREGECVALKFNTKGYHAFVLDYSTYEVAPNNCKHPQQLLELAASVKMIRENANIWGIDKDKIVIVGFSAGGNLAANYGNYWHKELLDKITKDKEELRPNALILSYPLLDYVYNDEKTRLLSSSTCNSNVEMMLSANKVFLGEEVPSLEKQKEVSSYYNITSNTPPTFIWHTFEDELVYVAPSISYAKKLSEMGVPCEIHIYESGQHGLSLADETSARNETQINKNVATWFDMAINWLDKRMK